MAPRLEPNDNTDFEPSDWRIGPVFLVFASALLLLAVSAFAMFAAYPKALPDVSRALRIAPPGPLLQTNAQADLAHFRAGEDRRLNSYYWIDKQKGVVHIPIEQAMRKLVDSGSPGFGGKP